ncbi:anthranilate synthase [Actinoplanes utahensis]|uniref:Anthranilate synthase n=1 Tax=Actinoplanes utahensis TaxID=1869 RepID=A0A0A6UN31_ACTUT|nr:chorismate-binding protein [Actinoplanes utahensis]KHD77545.1 anthranilate synthase [Actinoplanes utahensis]
MFRWHQGDPGDPAELLAGFLADNGLPVRNLGRTGDQDRPIGDGEICGAALYVSADAGSVMAGGAPGAPTPVPVVPDVYAVVYAHGAPVAPSPASGPWSLGPWRESWSRDEHAEAVQRVRAAIGRGDVYQVNVVGHASAPYRGDPAAALRRVAGLAGARYGGVLAGDGWAMATASPETLVEVRDGRVITRPIKGTRPATEAGRRELLASAKERAEHVMIVDLERNDLARLPGTGPVRVDELFAVREWSGLWQAESVVSAPLDGAVGLAALLRAVCPGGSVTGAPKLAALRQIAALEPVGRGVSMGALGWLGHDHLDLGLSIRTVATDGDRVHVWAGGGITIDSDPIAEVDEAAAKSAPVRAALRGPTVRS